MSITGVLKGQWSRIVRSRVERKLSQGEPKFSLERANWPRSLADPTTFYLECLRYFYQQLPFELREHRAWFHNVPSDRRGFGEDAFHVLWFLLFSEFKPANFLEIGVFRGQTISLAALLARIGGFPCDVYGISPFTMAGDTVSSYRSDIDYFTDTLVNCAKFHLKKPNLLRAFSTDKNALDLIASRPWDMIYIDGNHDYEVASKDWNACAAALKPGGIVVLDDSGLSSTYRPPIFATGGHPGPSRIAQEIDRLRFKEILQVGHNRAFQKVA